MSSKDFKFFTILVFAAVVKIATAQEVTMDHEYQIILSSIKKFDGVYICPDATFTLPKLRENVDAHLNKQSSDSASDDAIAKAVYTLFPCPFSPYVDYVAGKYRPATAKDIEGAWIYPEASMKFRFGPKSPNWSRVKAQPIKCEAVVYQSDGVVLHGQIAGNMACPFTSAKAIENTFRPYPKVESWRMVNDGRIKISRSDIPSHIEEWEVHVVKEAHERYGIQFNVGDLVSYMRREKGNEYNVATLFWHLQRLP